MRWCLRLFLTYSRRIDLEIWKKYGIYFQILLKETLIKEQINYFIMVKIWSIQRKCDKHRNDTEISTGRSCKKELDESIVKILIKLKKEKDFGERARKDEHMKENGKKKIENELIS